MPGQRLAYVDFASSDYQNDHLIMDPPLDEANVITSLVDRPAPGINPLYNGTLHKIVLDVDYQAGVVHDVNRNEWWLTIYCPLDVPGMASVEMALRHAKVATLKLTSNREFVVIGLANKVRVLPSSTPGHSHVYVDALVEHNAYMDLINTLADVGILQPGYVGASEDEGYTCVRLPWVRKEDVPLKSDVPDLGVLLGKSTD